MKAGIIGEDDRDFEILLCAFAKCSWSALSFGKVKISLRVIDHPSRATVEM